MGRPSREGTPVSLMMRTGEAVALDRRPPPAMTEHEFCRAYDRLLYEARQRGVPETVLCRETRLSRSSLYARIQVVRRANGKTLTVG
jgi:hypothetical protein